MKLPSSIEIEQNDDEYFAIPEDAIKYLPEEWREPIQAQMDNGRAVLKSIDKELSQLFKLINSIPSLITLKHIRDRMVAYEFSANIDSILENEMLTTAFVVTYVRLHHGGDAVGFSRKTLPENLRKSHDEIIEFRNKRYAHNDGHPSVESATEIQFYDNTFSIRPTLKLGTYIGGALAWRDLVDFLDQLTHTRIHKLLAALKTKTGLNWTFPSGPETKQ
ncbi:hypothetical protein [Roseococcus sp.]|uniref:hypothetical protein n=1 Tax=Roseococcus sp. TaxID=2109646 RepID=UPI003BAAAF5D